MFHVFRVKPLTILFWVFTGINKILIVISFIVKELWSNCSLISRSPWLISMLNICDLRVSYQCIRTLPKYILLAIIPASPGYPPTPWTIAIHWVNEMKSMIDRLYFFLFFFLFVFLLRNPISFLFLFRNFILYTFLIYFTVKILTFQGSFLVPPVFLRFLRMFRISRVLRTIRVSISQKLIFVLCR